MTKKQEREKIIAQALLIAEALKIENESKRPIIDTIVNTSALALTSYGVLQVTVFDNLMKGLICLSFGMLLEFIKYEGRKKKIW